MSDTVTTESTDTTTTTPEVKDAPETFSREYVEELRRENAAHRTGKTAAVDAAKAEAKRHYEALLAEKDTAYTALQNDLGNAWIELEKLQTTLALKVPSERVQAFASFLQGTDKDSIGESAKAAYELAGGFKTNSPAFDPTQGRGGGGGKDPLALNGDPIMQALWAAVNKGK
ncbi:scaffolding protein [Mycobacterium phage Steamy]|uniref:Scaffolding protein n=1 Tax=Mycobacterium phage Steamy TaxID=2250309 RepID=A0A345L0I9_9CAUD|nr:head scaffolding protein [Mycobacterium phage Steamy]AXH48791.1 scaffolding protein [Mycobacterium phage Steamy]